MSDSIEVNGQCLCGAVHLKARLEKCEVDACHCDMCRRWSGGPMLAVSTGDSVSLEGENDVSVYGSSDWAERGFCKHCGTHLFYRLKDEPHYALPVGLLDEGPDWEFNSEIYIEEKPDFYAFANETRQMTGKEVLEEFGRP